MQIFYWTGVILDEVSFALEVFADNRRRPHRDIKVYGRN